MDWQDVRVLEPRDQLDLAKEALRTQGGGKVRVHDLERNQAVVLQVSGEVHGGHSATSQLALELVTAR
jgi:hypothetical protein